MDFATFHSGGEMTRTLILRNWEEILTVIISNGHSHATVDNGTRTLTDKYTQTARAQKRRIIKQKKIT